VERHVYPWTVVSSELALYKDPTKPVGLVQSRHHLIKCNLFSPWYGWKIAWWNGEKMAKIAWHGTVLYNETIYQILYYSSTTMCSCPNKIWKNVHIGHRIPLSSYKVNWIFFLQKDHNSRSEKVVTLKSHLPSNGPWPCE